MIGGAFSVVGLLIAKDQKVSEFRQAWIDALRQDIANAIRHFEHMCSSGLSEAERNLELQQYRLHATASRLRLISPAGSAKPRRRLWPRRTANASHLAVLAILDRLDDRLARGDYPLAEVRDDLRELSDAAAVVLKEDWERVKRGEDVYRVALFGAAATVFATVVVLLAEATIGWSGRLEVQSRSLHHGLPGDPRVSAGRLQPPGDPIQPNPAGQSALGAAR